MKAMANIDGAPRKLGGGGARTTNEADSSTRACRAFEMPSEREHEDALLEWGIGIGLCAVWALCCLMEALA